MPCDMLFYVGVKAVIRNAQGSILLLRIRSGQPDAYWDLPGGRVKEGERLTQALKREVEEETDINDLMVERSLGTMLTPARLKAPAVDPAGLLFVVYGARSAACTAHTEPGVQGYWAAPEEAAKLLQTSPNIPAELIAKVGLSPASSH